MFTSNTLHNFPELYYIETFIGEYLINSLFNIHLLSVCHLEHKGRDTNRSILESHGEERSGEVADSWAVFQTEAVIWPQPAFVTLGFMACPPSSFLISLNIFCVLQTQLAPPPSLYLLQWFSVLSPSYLSPSAAHLVLAWPASFSYSILWCAWVWFLVLFFDYIYTHIWKSLSLPVLYCYFYFCLAFSLVAQLCLTLCETMDCSTPGFLVHHQLQELTQTHVHWVRDAIQPSHSLLSPSPLAFNLSQHQGFFFSMSQFFASGGQSIEVSASASVLPMNVWNWFPLGLTGWISLQSKWLSRVFSNTTVQKHQFFGAQFSLWSNSHIHTWLLEKTIALTTWTFAGKVTSTF